MAHLAAQIKEREERLTELDQLNSGFVSSVSCELKTPLTTIKVLAHLLQGVALGDDERIDYSKTIATECDRQIHFVGNLLDLSRIESGATEAEDRVALAVSRGLTNKEIAVELEITNPRRKDSASRSRGFKWSAARDRHSSDAPD